MDAAAQLVKLGGLHVVVWLHTANDPPKNEWDSIFTNLMEYAKTNRVDLKAYRQFVVSDGGAPNAVQRTQTHKMLWREHQVASSVITLPLNPLKRGIATAIGWLNPGLLFFEPDQIQKALAHVNLSDQIDGLWRTFGELQAQLPPVKALEMLASSIYRPRLRAAVSGGGAEARR
jgi:hypothetical protein